MRLVIDTMVVSGLLWLGNPGRLLEVAALGQVTLYTSPALLAELATTLATPKLARTTIRSGLTLDDLLARYANVAIHVFDTDATVRRQRIGLMKLFAHFLALRFHVGSVAGSREKASQFR